MEFGTDDPDKLGNHSFLSSYHFSLFGYYMFLFCYRFFLLSQLVRLLLVGQPLFEYAKHSAYHSMAAVVGIDDLGNVCAFPDWVESAYMSIYLRRCEWYGALWPVDQCVGRLLVYLGRGSWPSGLPVWSQRSDISFYVCESTIMFLQGCQFYRNWFGLLAEVGV